MATEKVKFEIKVFDNFIEIIPTGGLKDNSIYEIKLNDIKPMDSKKEYVGDKNIKFATAMSPMYCTIMDVSSLLDVVDIPEDIVLYNIRESSKYASYVYETTFRGKRLSINSIPFTVKEFTRYKAAKDCLLKIYMSLITDSVIEGMLGEVKFKNRDKLPDIQGLLKYLDAEIKKWLDAIRGYNLEGRAKMKTAIRGYNHGGINPMTTAERNQTPKGVPISLNRGVY